MKLSNKKILILVVLVAAIACAGMLLLKPDKGGSVNNIENTQTSEGMQEIPNPAYTEEENPTKNDENLNGLDKPIFMYFVTNSDLANKTTKEVIDKLQKEYKDKVIFEIRNADEDPTLYDNFPIDGAMPMLIMQKKGGDISTFLFSNNDYAQLKAAIDQTL